LKASHPWILLENVSLTRDRRPILQDVFWEIEPSVHWAVLGANGSGKTTLLQLLAGYLWPTQGEITVLGHRFGGVDLRELRKKIGWVASFLQTPVPFSQKPLDFVVSGKFASLGIYDSPGEEDYFRARELARRMECDDALDRPYGVLSQGEKQRLLVARALMAGPRLLILDEPCSGLDLVARERLLTTLEQLGSSPEGPNLVLVTHHLEEIVPAFHRVLLLKDGRVLASGPKEEILRGDRLREAFGIPLEIGESGGRYWTRVSVEAASSTA